MNTDVRTRSKPYRSSFFDDMVPLGKSFAGYEFFYDPDNERYLASNPYMVVFISGTNESDLHRGIDQELQRQRENEHVCGFCGGTGIDQPRHTWTRDEHGWYTLWVRDTRFDEWKRAES